MTKALTTFINIAIKLSINEIAVNPKNAPIYPEADIFRNKS